jgi:predicted porin
MKAKFPLFTLFAVLASSAAMAQSSVTLYGIADVFVGQKSTGTGAAKLKQTVVDSDGMLNSRWGLRGSENLGGGLKAEFQLESLFNISTGAVTQVTTVPAVVNPQLFSSQAWVGLNGGFGNIKLGRQVSPFHSFVGITNNLYDATAFSTTGTTWGMGNLPNYVGRFDNAISYESPVFGGVSGKVAYGFGEDKTVALSASKNTSLNLKYAAGPILAGYSYQKQSPVAPASALTYNMIGGAYDLGVARLVGGINFAKSNVAEDKEWQIGVNVPLGAFSVAAGYANSRGKLNGATGNKGTGAALLTTYELSKRTRLYAGYRKTTTKNATGATTNEASTLGLGIVHRF